MAYMTLRKKYCCSVLKKRYFSSSKIIHLFNFNEEDRLFKVRIVLIGKLG